MPVCYACDKPSPNPVLAYWKLNRNNEIGFKLQTFLSKKTLDYSPNPKSRGGVCAISNFDWCFQHHILSLIAYTFRENGILFSLLLRSLWWVQIVGYVLIADRIRLFVHYTISLSSLCKLIWRHWTYKMPARYILSSVRRINNILSVIHYTI